MRLFSWFRRKKDTEADVTGVGVTTIEKFGEGLTPNLRALRFAMTVSDLMLSMGVAANSVVSRALDITETYCTRPVHIDIASNLIMFSQLRGVEKEPLTLIRPVTGRDVNYMVPRNVQNLIHEIRKGNISLDDAEARLDEIIQKPRAYPWWLVMTGNGVLVSGVSLMFTSSWQAILTAFVIGIAVDRLVFYLTKRTYPAFFRQVIAAAFVTVTAAALNQLAKYGVSFFADMNPTLIVVGGIVMLVAGLAFVGSIQDAIEEYYLTANARLTRVFLQTTGIVVGIMVGLYIARKFGVGIAVSPDPLTLNIVQMQILGAGVATIGYAIATHTYAKAILWIGAIGAAGLAIFYESNNLYGISSVPASGIAAIFVGIVAALMSRFWRTPSVGIISAGIVPLVPGLMLYNGLMQLINYPPGDPLFFKALGTLFTVGSVGLAIAAGATLGSLIGRPMHQRLTRTRNVASFANFMKKQVELSHRSKLARMALSGHHLLFSRRKTTPPANDADVEQ